MIEIDPGTARVAMGTVDPPERGVRVARQGGAVILATAAGRCGVVAYMNPADARRLALDLAAAADTIDVAAARVADAAAAELAAIVEDHR